MANDALNKSRKRKDDEFYTKKEDVIKELDHYTEYFKNKVIYLNADDPKRSEFYRYFRDNFEKIKPAKVICTYYAPDQRPFITTITKDGEGIVVRQERSSENGDFRSEECLAILRKADIVITNPPFSLMTEYFRVLFDNSKQFLIIGNMTAIGRKHVAEQIRDEKVWLGYTQARYFVRPDGTRKSVAMSRWFTNLPTDRRCRHLELTRVYTPEDYPKYETYDAIDIDKVVNIPKDYKGLMGVPITYLDKHNPDDFEILGIFTSTKNGDVFLAKPVVNGKEKFTRIAIRKRQHPKK